MVSSWWNVEQKERRKIYYVRQNSSKSNEQAFRERLHNGKGHLSTWSERPAWTKLTAQNEVKVIVELKDAVKQGKVISYLSGELNKSEEKKPETKPVQPAEKKPEQKPEHSFY